MQQINEILKNWNKVVILTFNGIRKLFSFYGSFHFCCAKSHIFDKIAEIAKTFENIGSREILKFNLTVFRGFFRKCRY